MSLDKFSYDPDWKPDGQAGGLDGFSYDPNYKPQDGGFKAAAKQTAGQTIKGIGQLAADYVPGVTADNALSRYGQSVVDANPTAVHGFGDLADKPWTAVKETLGNAVSGMGGMVGARLLGQGITAAAPLTGPLAPLTAAVGQGVAWGGPALMAALPSYSGIREGQQQAKPEGADTFGDKALALGGAGLVGAIESKFGPQDWALKAMTKEGRDALAEKFAAQSLKGAIGKGIVKGGAIEGAEELAQNPIEQLASYRDPTTGESLTETAFGGVMGGIGGGLLGGAGGGINYMSQGPRKPAGPLTRAAETATATGAAQEQQRIAQEQQATALRPGATASVEEDRQGSGLDHRTYPNGTTGQGNQVPVSVDTLRNSVPSLRQMAGDQNKMAPSSDGSGPAAPSSGSPSQPPFGSFGNLASRGAPLEGELLDAQTTIGNRPLLEGGIIDGEARSVGTLPRQALPAPRYIPTTNAPAARKRAAQLTQETGIPHTVEPTGKEVNGKPLVVVKRDQSNGAIPATAPAEAAPQGVDAQQHFAQIKNQAYRVASGIFGKDIYAKSVQNDWQRLLDAIDSQDGPALNALAQKYRKDEERDGLGTGTAGAGPGKVKQSRRGAAQLAIFARDAAAQIGGVNATQTQGARPAGVDAAATGGNEGSARAPTQGAAQVQVPAIPAGNAEVQAPDVSGKDAAQLDWLSKRGINGWKEAAQAEIARRKSIPDSSRIAPDAPQQAEIARREGGGDSLTTQGPAVVSVKDVYGRTVRVRQADLNGDADRIPTVRPNGDTVAGEDVPRDILPQQYRNAPQQAQPAPTIGEASAPSEPTQAPGKAAQTTPVPHQTLDEIAQSFGKPVADLSKQDVLNALARRNDLEADRLEANGAASIAKGVRATAARYRSGDSKTVAGSTPPQALVEFNKLKFNAQSSAVANPQGAPRAPQEQAPAAPAEVLNEATKNAHRLTPKERAKGLANRKVADLSQRVREAGVDDKEIRIWANAQIDAGFNQIIKQDGKLYLSNGSGQVLDINQLGGKARILVRQLIKAEVDRYNIGKDRTPASKPEQVAGEEAAPAGEKGKTLVKTRTLYGDTVHVRQPDLDGAGQTLRAFTADGKPKGRVHRENLDPDGRKQAESNKEDASNPFFDVVTAKDGKTFANTLAAARERKKRGLVESHGIVPASEVQAGKTGFVLKRNAPSDATEVSLQATHQDPGRPPEPATHAVVAESLQKGDANSRLNIRQMRERLIGEIDAAIDETFKSQRLRELMQKRERISQEKPSLSKNDRLASISKEIGYVTFDVPGDGKFKVVNSPVTLMDFKRKVEASPGFREQRSASSQHKPRKNASTEEVRRMVNAPLSDKSASLDDLANAIEIARANGIDDIPGLLDRFKEVANMYYDTWRGEQDAEDAAKAANEKAAPSISPAFNAGPRGSETRERPEVRADESGSPAEPAQIGGDGGGGGNVANIPLDVQEADLRAARKERDILDRYDLDKAREVLRLARKYAPKRLYGPDTPVLDFIHRAFNSVREQGMLEAKRQELADALSVEIEPYSERGSISTNYRIVTAPAAVRSMTLGDIEAAPSKDSDQPSKAADISQGDRPQPTAKSRELSGGQSEQKAADSARVVAQKAGLEKGGGKADGEKRNLEDFGEKLEGARKDREQALRKEYSDDDLASLPFSKIWPAADIDAIEDPFIAAVAHSARAAIPAKPRQPYKVKRWVEAVKKLRGMAAKMTTVGVDRARELFSKETISSDFVSKVALLEAIGRDQWGRIGNVVEAPDAYGIEEGKKIPQPYVMVQVDGRSQIYEGSGVVADVVDRVNEKLGVAVQPKKMKFEVRGRGDKWFINKTGDNEYRQLKTFTTSKEALAYKSAHYDDLVAAWDAVKNRDNVTKADVRRSENRPRTGQDWRNGKDVTSEQFESAFGFRGGQFGNWVKQGANAKERQWMLNSAYDALMDLSRIVGIPPKAISLNGTLGMSFGARGHGWASAHFEPDTLVINLTKTRGAGTLAHEWFHALDNYFSRMRRGGEESPFDGDNNNYRRENYITYRPEAYYEKDGMKIPAGEFDAAVANGRETAFSSRPGESRKHYFTWQQIGPTTDGWIKRDAVRPEVEERFAGLVNALNESPMKARAARIDKNASEGYWSRIIERAARSFENYVIAKMMSEGYHNDHLANVVNTSEFVRSSDRYPYLKPEEMAPVVEAFDNLFGTIQTKETDKGTAMFSRTPSPSPRSTVAQVRAELDKSTLARLIAPLERRGLLKLHETVETLPDMGGLASSNKAAWRTDRNVSRDSILAANRFGLNERKSGGSSFVSWYSHEHSAAYRFGTEGVDLSKQPTVTGWRRGQANFGGISHNYRDDISERGLSMMSVEGGKPGFSEMFMGGRDKHEYTGLLLPHAGADGEPLILPYGGLNLDADDQLFSQNNSARTAGYFDGKTLHLVAANLKPGTAAGVLLHEGWHKFLHATKFADSDKYAKLMQRLSNLEKITGRGKDGDWVVKAALAIPTSDRTSTARRLNELAAYAIQQYETDPRSVPQRIAKWVQDFIASVREWMMRKVGWMPKEVTQADLAAMARRYLAELANGEEVGPVGGEAYASATGTVNVDGVERPTTNSNGQLIHPTEEGIRNFWRWFGESRVVDEQGRPLVVYHGTASDFSRFSKDAIGKVWGADYDGFFFTTDTGHSVRRVGLIPSRSSIRVTNENGSAGEYAEKASKMNDGGAASVIPVYLKVDRPLEYSTDDAASETHAINYFDGNKERFVKKAGKESRDGIVVRERRAGQKPIEVWAVFNPEQIKSAIGNRGPFDASNPDILFSRTDDTGNAWLESQIASNPSAWRLPRSKIAEMAKERRAYLEKQASSKSKFASKNAQIALARNDHAELIESAHKIKSLRFSPLTSEEFAARVGMLLHQSPSYGKTGGSSYRLILVDGKPAYARESNHWGKFSTSDWVDGEQQNTDYNWTLDGVGQTQFGDKKRHAGYILLSDLEKMAATSGNRGDFTRDDDTAGMASIADGFSRATDSQAFQKTGQFLSDLTNTHSTFGPLRGLKTQYHKATQNPLFKAFWERSNAMAMDSARAMIRPADLAPRILPKFDPRNVKEAAKALFAGRSDVQPVDLKAVAQALSDGTLDGGPSPLKGKIWTDEDLAKRGMSEKQASLYREARSAIDASLTEAAAAEAWKIARRNLQNDFLRQRVADVPEDAAVILPMAMDQAIAREAEALREMQGGMAEAYDPAAAVKELEAMQKRISAMQEDADAIKAIFKKSEQLKDAGYMPLMRFGKYRIAVTMKENGKEAATYVGRYESHVEANQARRELEKQFSGDEFTVGPVSVENENAWKMFKGVNPETVMLFAEEAGIKADDVMQEWYRDAVSNRSALRRMVHRTGVSGYSEDLPRVLASFITSNGKQAGYAYHLDDMQKMLQDKAMPGDVQEEAQSLLETIQEPNERGAAMRGLMATWYLLGSVGAALVNSTQTVTMSIPWLSQFGAKGFSATEAASAMGNAYKMVLKPLTMPADLRAAMKRAEQNGIVDSNEVFHLYAESMKPMIAKLGSGNMGYRARAFMTLWGAPFAMVETLNRRTTFAAAYNMARAQGKTDVQASAFAERAVIETQGIYAKHNRPNWSRGTIGAAALTFKQFPIAYVEMLARMAKSGPDGKKAALLALGVLFTLAGVSGLPGEDDLLDMIDTFSQIFFGKPTISRMEIRNFLTDNLGKELGGFINSGVSNFLPVDVSSRLGLGNLIPGTGLFKPSTKDKTGELVEIFAGVQGGFVQSMVDSVRMLAEGNLGGAVKTAAPKAVQDVAKGVEMLATGEARDRAGRKVVDTDAQDAMWQMIGLNPNVKADAGKKAWDVTEYMDYVKRAESNIVGRMARGVVDGDMEAIHEAQQALTEWNLRNPDSPIGVSRAQVMQRVQALRMERAGRIEKMAPREMRTRVRELMEED